MLRTIFCFGPFEIIVEDCAMEKVDDGKPTNGMPCQRDEFEITSIEKNVCLCAALCPNRNNF
jgi:hypothetical protein